MWGKSTGYICWRRGGAKSDGPSIEFARCFLHLANLKTDGHLGRCYLKGRAGDAAANATLSAVGYNLRLVLAWLRILLCLILVAITRAFSSQPALKPGHYRGRTSEALPVQSKQMQSKEGQLIWGILSLVLARETYPIGQPQRTSRSE